jgi:hypothetical protein
MKSTARTELERLTRVKVSGLARALPGFSYAAIAAGAGISSLFLFQTIPETESISPRDAGAFLRSVGDINLPAMVGLYLGAILGFAGVVFAFSRLMVNTSTASPPGAIFIVPGILGLLPAFILWTAESRLISALVPGGLDVGTDPSVVIASASNLLLLNIPVSLVGTIVALLVSLVPFEYRMLRTPLPLLVVTIFSALTIYAMFGFQYRTWWLFNVPY